MPRLPAVQQALLKKPFMFGCSTAVFPPEEKEFLMRFGNLLEALVRGDVKPATKDQEHFLKVERGEAEPKSVGEHAWDRLKGRREYEREQKIAPPPPPSDDDYGMVEFDADRCWW